MINMCGIKIMNKFRIFVAVCSIVMAGNSVAQDASAGGGLKIAILDMAAALYNSELAAAVQERLSVETANDSGRIRELAQEGTALQERLRVDAEVLSEAERRTIMEELEAFEQTYSSNLIQAISDVVEEQNFDIVLRAEVALFYKGALDITAQVTAKLNAQQ